MYTPSRLPFLANFSSSKILSQCALGLTTLLCASGILASTGCQMDDQQFSAAMGRYLESDAGKDAIGGAMEKYFGEKSKRGQEDQEKRAKEEMEKQFKNPLKVDVGSSPVKGDSNAPITIVEFSDFECPFCKRGTDTAKKIMEMYPGKVKLVFKHAPLPFHQSATPAAKASIAAAKQGKFWEYHDVLFSSQGQLAPDVNAEFYVKTAKDLGLNVDKFKADLKGEDIEKTLKSDQAEGQKLSVQGTPAFFVNGVAVRGAYPVEHFKMIIDRLLAAG